MSASVHSITTVDCQAAGSLWREAYLEKLDTIMDTLESRPMSHLGDITGSILENKSGILGELAWGLIACHQQELLAQEILTCPHCGKLLKKRGAHSRQVETLVGTIRIERPFFYCASCKKGLYPMDEALGLAPEVRQYDLQDIEAWLGSELPFETAAEAIERCTGQTTSAHTVHDATNAIAQEITILDVCPTREEIEAKVKRFSQGKFRRPVLMLAVDGANAPVRPEPSGRSEKRGKNDWREVKGFRLYLLDPNDMEHIASWHQIGTDEDLTASLRQIRDAGLIDDRNARLCVVADGAPWIWNRIGEIFPNAREVLDFYHCSEHLHKVAGAQYGKGSREAREWVDATITRLFDSRIWHVLSGLECMKPSSDEAKKEISNLMSYLRQHKERIDYGRAKRGGYHIGSGAIESANKFIAHVRLKRSGASWYPTHVNDILKLRCAKANGLYDRVVELYRKRDQEKLRLLRSSGPEGGSPNP